MLLEKFSWENRDLELEVGDIMYIHGMDLQDCIPADLSLEAKQSHFSLLQSHIRTTEHVLYYTN